VRNAGRQRFGAVTELLDASRARIASNKRAKGRAARSDFTFAREYTEANGDQEQHKVGNDRHPFGWQDAVCAVSLGVGALLDFG
jgi:hypothetical protein